jgi:cystathionine beta-lyase/cystathionine gamma-synthase
MSEDRSPSKPRRGFEPLPEWVGPTTRLVHGARRADLNAGSVVAPIYQTSTFHFPAERSEGRERGGVYLYTRNDNPTTEGPAELLRQLEGGEACRLYASGMGAMSSAALSLVKSGDTVVALRGIYGVTTHLLRNLLPRFGVHVVEVAGPEAETPETVVPAGAKLVILESPTNPLLEVHDLARWARAAHAAGALVLVDNTFASPINQRPLALGADVVMHSATKYLGGHSDLVGGALVGSTELLDRIDPPNALGATMDPFASFLLDRSLKTLDLRVARHNENGRRVAEAAARHRNVRKVHYPGTASPAQEAIARRQMTGRGGVLSLSLKGGAPAVERFLDRLRFVHVASSLGGVESLASVPAATSHRHLPAEEREGLGIDAGLVRLALGIEDPVDLVRDVEEALDGLG